MLANGSLHRLLPPIRSACHREPVDLAYLFGSHARGTADAESDIDVAVLAHPTLSNEQRLRLRLRLLRSLADTLGLPIDRLDVVVLQDVPALLQLNVIRTGQVVFGEAAARRSFELGVERRYEDESPYLDREADLTLDRILSHAP